MQILKTILVGAMLAGAVLLTPSHSGAQPASGATEPVEVVEGNGDVKLKLNFQDTPLQAVLEYLSEKAGLTVISDAPISDGRMTVISRQPISLDHAVSLINSILKERGLTTVLVGRTLKVVTLANAKQETIPVRTGRDPKAVVPSDDIITYVVPVSHVTAAALRQNLSVLVPAYASIEANEDGNALIITDTAANIRRLMEIIQALDTHMSNVAEIRVFRLVNADATSTATLINTIFQQQNATTGTRTGARNPIEMMMQMRGGPGGRGGFGGRGGERDGDGQTAGATVNVQVVAAADDRTNAVVVRGPADALEIVSGMIAALDDRTAKVAGIKVFQLRYADAMNTADVINKLFGDGQSTTQTGQGGPMMFRGPGGRGGMPETQQDSGSGTSQVVAAADSQTNTVVVTGPDAILEVVAEVVKSLDAQVPNVADVKVFHLEYADARDTADLINDVFGDTGTAARRTTTRTQQAQQVQFQRGGFPGAQQQTTQGGSPSDVSVVAAADSRTNAVVVSGPPTTLEIVSQIIKELDQDPKQERRIFVYALKNANATNLKDVLNSLFAEIQALNQATTGTGQQFQGAGRQQAAPQATGTTTSTNSSSTNDLSEETYFEAETETNSLLILTSTKNYERVRPIIEELDKPVGQVLIKVLFAEITYSDKLDIGTEFSMLNLRSNGDSTRTSTLFGEPSQGLFVNSITGDLDITLHALQEAGKLNILSRPYILTSNNQAATITVGSQVPFATGETTSNVGTQTTTEYRDIGIILVVTPSINPEGLVNMTVRPEISSTTGETIQISEKLNLPVFATRSSETKVAVRDGQTIVIGGLIQDEIRDTIKKVPLLGDIPIAGHLFKRTEKTKAKTELLIFLTPHVAPDALALSPISDAVRARTNFQSDRRSADLFREHIEAMEEDPARRNEP
ncbi:secretin N-terminal domain-containing protein [Anaerobaca lacustris]|uniref:Secretin N-terminal domain-containing protein n=1 Tax=Anaerobaca lacustris TaxID=3044600 RepID=A0AAW6U1G2_9BACT|nr:secretin N-terminal domain-containing protein [Sedimentisphaerales bacterium M17dextr]